MRALDLFCGAGGASAGLALAGFDVTGVDAREQPHYPFKFVRQEFQYVGLDFMSEFDFIWASPPCQAFTAYKRRKDHVKPAVNLIPEVRAILSAAGVPYVIENVPGARDELIDPVQLCGSSFGLDVRRHRLFEAHGFRIEEIECNHAWQTPRFPPATNRKNPRRTVEIGVWRIPLEEQKAAMGGCWWMNLEELSQAIPPAYAYHIAQSFLS